MKNIILLIIIALGAYLGIQKINANTSKTTEVVKEDKEEKQEHQASIEGDFVINTEASTIEWIGKKLGTIHEGSFNISEGTFNEDLTGSLIIDMGSVVTEPEMLVEHLKSADFLNIAEFPVATFVAKTYVDGMLTGDLTILGTTHELSVPVTVNLEGDTLTLDSSFEMNRTDWGIVYQSSSFFAGIGDKAINDMIPVAVHIEAVKKNG